MFDSFPAPDPAPPLQQSDGFARSLQALGQPCLRLPDGTLALRRRWGPLQVHMVARGPSVHLGDQIAHLRQAGLRGPVILAPDHPVAAAGLPLVPLVSPANLAVLDLAPPVETLRAGLHQKWRNRLRHSERQGLHTTRQNMPARPDHWLLLADEAQQAGRGYRSWPTALTCAFAQENRGAAKLFTASVGRRPVAGVLVLRHGTRATYHIGHTRAAGRATSAHTLLLWQAICWLKRKGVTQLELGLVDTEEGAGLARFKLGTGAAVRPLGGTWLWWPPLTCIAVRLQRFDRRLMQAL